MPSPHVIDVAVELIESAKGSESLSHHHNARVGRAMCASFSCRDLGEALVEAGSVCPKCVGDGFIRCDYAKKCSGESLNVHLEDCDECTDCASCSGTGRRQ